MPTDYKKHVVRGIGAGILGVLAFAYGFNKEVEVRRAHVEKVSVLWYHFPKNDTLPSGEIIVKTPEEKDSIPEGIELKIKETSFPIKFPGLDTSKAHVNDVLPVLTYRRGFPVNEGIFLMPMPRGFYKP